MIIDYLKKEDTFWVKLNQIRDWNAALKEALASQSSLSLHCQISNLKNNTLVIVVDNPHWKIRVQFLIPELLVKLRTCKGLENIKTISTKVVPQYTPIDMPVKKPSPQVRLSDKTAAFILEIANKLKDTKLQEVLKRIAGKI